MTEFLSDIFNFAKTAKAWAGALVAAIGAVVAAIQLAAADKAITFDEANGIWLAVTGVVTVLGTMFSVWKTSNKET